jgi:hypothetical protein
MVTMLGFAFLQLDIARTLITIIVSCHYFNFLTINSLYLHACAKMKQPFSTSGIQDSMAWYKCQFMVVGWHAIVNSEYPSISA